MSGPSFEELIERKRDGHEHTAEEIDLIVSAYTAGEVPDYQMSAWLMAALLRGLSADETVEMTAAMVRTGDVIDLSSVPGVKLDKHSTGGVGDTTTLVVAPLVASCGVPVAKMSGRGLGHTGGTLDKLESIPGYRVELTAEQFVSQVRSIRVAVIAQSPSIVPADRRIYALRDVTGTVLSIPLIVSSIVSKKVAGGADAVLVDVKVGSGAFMKTDEEARQLAHDLSEVGAALGRRVECVISDMDRPLGRSVGNSLEVMEAIQVLKGDGGAELTELCLTLAAKMLVMGRAATDESAGRAMACDAIATGRAIERFSEWIVAQGGDGRIVDDPGVLPLGRLERVVVARSAGYVTRFDTHDIGRAAMLLGAGRERVGDVVDPGAGLLLQRRLGEHVAAGEPLCTLYSSDAEKLDMGEERVDGAIHVGPVAVEPQSLFRSL